MSIVVKHELTSSVTLPSGTITASLPPVDSINLYYYQEDNSIRLIDNTGSVTILNSFNNTPYSASNVGNGTVALYSGSTTTQVLDTEVYTTETINFKFYSLSGSGIYTINTNNTTNTIEISNSLSGNLNTEILYSASNIGVGLPFFSGTVINGNNRNFVFNSITSSTENPIIISKSNNIVNISSNITVSLDTVILTYGATTQSFIQPDPTFFSSATFVTPDRTSHSFAWPISGVVYLFGTYNPVTNVGTSKVLYATMSNPTSWSQVSGVVDFFQGEHQAIIGNKIYHFGGYQNGTLLAHSTIYSASVENPLSWSNTGASIPAGRTHSCLYVSKETGKIIIYGGGDSNASPVPQNTIYTASISNPLVWGTAPTTLPGINMGQTLMEAGDWIYLYGGYSTGSVIWRAHKTNPTVVSNTSYTLTQSLIFSCQPIQIGNYAYIFSNWVTNGTYRIDINKPWAPEFISGTMSIPVALMRKNPVFIAQNKIFHLGGTDHPAIHTSSYYITSSTTMTSSSLYQNATAVIDINKQTTQYSSVEKFGASTIWQTDINR